jgi:hypothetical protein
MEQFFIASMYDWRTMLKYCHASVTIEEQSEDLAISTTEENRMSPCHEYE